jgi:hypothetical protein
MTAAAAVQMNTGLFRPADIRPVRSPEGQSAEAGTISRLFRETTASIIRTVTARSVLAHGNSLGDQDDLPLLASNATFTITATFGTIAPLEPLPYPWDDDD